MGNFLISLQYLCILKLCKRRKTRKGELLMKKILSLALVLLVILGCLTACDLAQDLLGALEDEAESTTKVKEMMVALADDNMDDAKNLMHPKVVEAADPAITQMSAFLAGRNVNTLELISINIHTSTGTAGATRQEKVGYKVTLDDGAIIYINAEYLSDNKGTGFSAFQLVLGFV